MCCDFVMSVFFLCSFEEQNHNVIVLSVGQKANKTSLSEPYSPVPRLFGRENCCLFVCLFVCLMLHTRNKPKVNT